LDDLAIRSDVVHSQTLIFSITINTDYFATLNSGWTALVREKKIDDKAVYVCEICGLGYADKETANECEEWCKKTGTCSLKITSKAVYVPNPFENKSESR